MPTKNPSLHGSAPDKNDTALLLIDVINDLDFPEAEEMVGAAERMARNLLRLKERARRAAVPVIYVNDNFGKWKSDFRATITHCLRENSRGRKLVEILRPEEEDYFVLKPKHSGFFSTTLETLLRYLGSKRLILTGIAGNFCVLFTANDAYMRDFELVVPRDCTVSNTSRENAAALELMRNFLKATTPSGKEVKFARRRRKRS
jgi:nicotinamidase-related amidase